MLINGLRHIRRLHAQKNSSFFVTTPIFYVNAAPHIGHLYSAVIADAINRYQQLRYPQTPTHFCTGTDEHGTKIQQAAANKNVPLSKYCDDISQCYRQVFQEANIGYTDFIRTTEERHSQAVRQFWCALETGNHIYSAQYQGWYCVSDETFLTEQQLRKDPDTGKLYSLESGHPVEWTEEVNYMFRLSALQADVLYWIKQGGRVRPAQFEKILLDMCAEPLPDVSISRPANRVHWAIPVPGHETQTVYVWLDALINYLTTAGYPDSKFRAVWPPKVQVLGKDILKFHGIYWPAFLIAAGLEPPEQLFVHSHWTVDGQKMSKSKHNVVDPQKMAKLCTMEGLRYFLLREGVAHNDGNYSNVKLLRILNSELADTLGNLLSRCCAKSLNPRQIYPAVHENHLKDIMRMEAAQRLVDNVKLLEERCSIHYKDNNFYLVVDTVMSTLHAANNFFESARPWTLKSLSKEASGAAATISNDDNVNKLETIIAIALDTLRLCGIVLQPIVPQLSAHLLEKLSIPHEARMWQNLEDHFASKILSRVSKVAHSLGDRDAVLFRRIIVKESMEEQTPLVQKEPVPIKENVSKRIKKKKQDQTSAGP